MIGAPIYLLAISWALTLYFLYNIGKAMCGNYQRMKQAEAI